MSVLKIYNDYVMHILSVSALDKTLNAICLQCLMSIEISMIY